MAITVLKDIVHSAAYYRQRFDLGQNIFEARRVHAVNGITGIATAATFQAVAVAACGETIGNPHPNQTAANFGCVVREISAQTIPQSDDSSLVFIDYWTINPTTGGGVGIMSVVLDGALSAETVDLHPTAGQIMVDPGNLAGVSAKPVPGSVPSSTRIVRMIITAAVTPTYKDQVADTVGSVNNSNWFGRIAGFWIFNSIRESIVLGSATSIVECEFLRRARNWHEFDVRRSDVYGNFLTVDPAIVAQAQALAYQYGVKRFPGITVVGNFPLVDFKKLFGIDHWP